MNLPSQALKIQFETQVRGTETSEKNREFFTLAIIWSCMIFQHGFYNLTSTDSLTTMFRAQNLGSYVQLAQSKS